MMNGWHFSSVLLLALCSPNLLLAQDATSDSKSLTRQSSLNAEVGGLVVGQTMTLAGRAFYDSFALAWSEHDEAGRFSVAISERPTARLGSQVFVDYGNRRLLQMFLPPNRSLIPDMGAEAAANVYQAILDYQLSQFFGDPDMGRDEL